MRETIDLATLKPGRFLRFLYHTVPGRALLSLMIRPRVSKIVGWYMSTSFSKCHIRSFIKKNHIDVSRYDTAGVKSYNDFFCRPLRAGALRVGEGVIAPSDAKLTAYPVREDSVFTVKGSEFSLAEILGDAALAREFAGGVCLIFRLTVDNYHRYCYFDDCTIRENRKIAGVLHTVQPIAFHRYPVYHQNSREVTILDTAHCGVAAQIEVGALCVGKVDNYHHDGAHKKGEEKGRFLFGGSTVMLLLNGVAIDPEILKNTENQKETIVTIGEQIGTYEAEQSSAVKSRFAG